MSLMLLNWLCLCTSSHCIMLFLKIAKAVKPVFNMHAMLMSKKNLKKMNSVWIRQEKIELKNF